MYIYPSGLGYLKCTHPDWGKLQNACLEKVHLYFPFSSFRKTEFKFVGLASSWLAMHLNLIFFFAIYCWVSTSLITSQGFWEDFWSINVAVQNISLSWWTLSVIKVLAEMGLIYPDYLKVLTKFCRLVLTVCAFVTSISVAFFLFWLLTQFAVFIRPCTPHKPALTAQLL